MSPQQSHLACELFTQWQRARGGRMEPAQRPFSRRWEALLEDAHLVSATERADAERDMRALAADSLLTFTTVKYRPHLIERIAIPLAAEGRWREAFGFVPPTGSEVRRIREFDWEPELAFLREARINISFAELLRLNDFIKQPNTSRNLVPIKERSLQIFGDEKRLDLLTGSALFRDGRLDLALDLGCEVIGVPFAWKRGPAAATTEPILVIENAATWHSYCRWNSARSLFSAIVYGDGNRFADGVRYLPDLFAELGGPRRLLYFGDLDPKGLLIPQEASARAQALGLPLIQPHLWSYRMLLAFAATTAQHWEGERPSPTLCDWLDDCAAQALHLFETCRRLPQEHLGWEFLERQMTDSLRSST